MQELSRTLIAGLDNAQGQGRLECGWEEAAGADTFVNALALPLRLVWCKEKLERMECTYACWKGA